MLKRIGLLACILICPINTIAATEVDAPKAEVAAKHTESKVEPKPKEQVKPKEETKLKEVEPEVIEKKEEQPKGQHIVMEVTGYTAGYESTQKQKGEPGYGLTASGTYVKQGRTIAAGSQIPFGTKIYIPYFDKENGFDDGIFTVEDRGGAIGPYNIDVYYDSLWSAQQFGRQSLDVYIMEE